MLLFLVVFAIILIVYNIKCIKQIIRYYSGIGTSYCYFEAKQHCNDSILIYYHLGEFYDLSTPSIDSLQKSYGFFGEYPNEDVAYYIIDLYNTIIFKEVKQRVGENKWKEYELKEDSIYKSTAERYK